MINKEKILIIILTVISTIVSTYIYGLIREYNYGNDLSTILGFILATSLILFVMCIDKLIPVKKRKLENE